LIFSESYELYWKPVNPSCLFWGLPSLHQGNESANICFYQI
jgi:hypothetical protein